MEDYHQLLHDRVKEQAEKLGRDIDYIETGVCTGNSAEAVLSTNRIRSAVLIDLFPHEYYGHRTSKNNVEHRLQKYTGLFDVKEGDSRDILPTIEAEFDIGFVDGDHSNAGCLMDMTNMLPRIRHDGIMFVDDLGPTNNLQECVERFAFGNDLNMIIHNVHNGLAELTRKNGRT